MHENTLKCFILMFLLLLNTSSKASDKYVVLSWNDLGMHCYNRNFKDLAVLPPYNNLWAQVVKVGNPPQIITNGITVTYSFPANTYSAGKTDFWNYVLQLFGVDLAPNTGLKSKGMSGTMDLVADHFVAEGIPLTEFSDGDLNNRNPYQLAKITVNETSSGIKLAEATVVAPVSTEMRCDYCHYDGAMEGISTGRVETNILTLHDKENQDEYPRGHTGALMNRRPVLCAECHASNALGAAGVSGIPNLSKAMHEKHADKISQNLSGCYSCHPGPQTQCLRDVMSLNKGMDCIDCHGTMSNISRNSNPWLIEPRCDSTACHGSQYAQDQPLYRMSKGHGGIYCEACHDSTHAIAPSREPDDAIKFIALQGYAGTLNKCTACHSAHPVNAGPHGLKDVRRGINPGIFLLLE
jgi:hypothetical protein